jgi:hypothetical protein
MHHWRAAIFAASCAGLIMHAGSVGAQLAATPGLLAQGAGARTTSDVPAEAAARLPPAVPDAANEAAAAATPGWFGWGLAPMRWGGSLISEVRLDKSGDQPRRLQQNEIANIKGSSYIWQPWFGLVSGGLGFLASKERRGDGAGLADNPTPEANSNAVTGNGEVTLFPVSRFPFNAYFDVSDSRASGELSTSDFSSTRFGVRQTYQPPEGNANYGASFNRSTLESAAFGRDTVNALAASMNRNVGPHGFDASGSHTRNTRSKTRESTALSQLTARHSYRPEPALSVESLASASSSDFHLLSAGVPTANRSQFAQASTFANWRPEEGSPLYVTGGGRMFRSMIASNAGETEALTLSGNGAATYALSRQTSVSGSAAVTQLMTDTINALLTAQTANVTHIGDPVGVLGVTYTWTAGSNVANQTGLPEGTRQNLGGQFEHGVTRSLMLGEGSHVNFSLGQSLGTNFDTVTARSHTLSHNGSASWRLTRDAATSAFVSVLGADSRTSGTNENQFQLVNFQASGQVQFSRNSSAAANLTVQGVRQSTPSTPTAGFDFNSSGNLSYFHLRAFDVPRLRYTALYSINDSQFTTRLQGDVNAPRERVTQSFEQRLDYNIGRVAFRLSMRIAEIEGRRDALVFFRMARDFGGF